jgi:acetyl esterase/lipase
MRNLGSTNFIHPADTPRFAKYKNGMLEHVQYQNFAGYWLVKGEFGMTERPADCDLVLYYIHGGGYSAGSPFTSLATFLRIAEILSAKGSDVAIFALEYTLVPEAAYPTQRDQAVAGYHYLVDKQKVKPSRLAVIGDSAGAHLSLCMLIRLRDLDLPRPDGGVFLIAPWIDLLCSTGASFTHNEHKDFLNKESLTGYGRKLIGCAQSDVAASFVDFGRPRPARSPSWAQILPAKLWVSAGSNEVFFDDIMRFVRCLEDEGLKVVLDVANAKVHTWQLLEDLSQAEKYYKTAEGSDVIGLMPGAANIAAGILSLYRG